MAEAPNAPAPITDSVTAPEAESRMDSTPVVARGDPMDVSSVPPTEQERRHRKITSEVWSDFQREKNIDGSITATCNIARESLMAEV